MTLAYASAARAALRTSTGTQDFTAPSFGTPVGAIVLLTNATSDGTEAATKRWSIGFTDGTRHRVAATMSQDGVTTSSNYRAKGSARLALLIKTDGSAHDVEVQFDSFITDGIRLNVSTTDGVAYLCTVILFGGADCDLYVNDFDIGSVTAGATLDVTDPGFQPSFIFFVQANGTFSSGSPTPSAGEMVSLAFAADSGSNEQARFSYAHGNAKTTSEPSLNTPATLSTNFTNVLTAAPLSPSTGAGLKVNSYLSNGFQVISPNGGDTPAVAYMAVTFGTTPDIALVTTPTTATTRTVSMTDPGCAFFINTIAAATGNLAGNTAGQVGFGFANSSVAFCIGQNEHDNQSTMDNGVLSDDVPIHLLLDDGSATAIKATASFSTTELTLTYSDVQSTARNNYVLLLPRPTFSGTGAGNFPLPTGTGVGTLDFVATGAGSFPLPSGTGVGTLAFVATGAGSFPLPTGTGVGTLAFVATGAGSFPLPSGTGVGTLEFIATGAGSFPLPTGTGVGTLDFVATGAGSFPLPTGTGVGLLEFVLTGAGSFPLPSGTGAGLLEFVATGAGLFPLPTGTGVGAVVVPITGTGAGDFPLPLGTGSGELIFLASGAGLFPLPTGTGTGSNGAQFGCVVDLLGSRDRKASLIGTRDALSSLTGGYNRRKDLRGANC